jgi:SAM-dependent methyltransferase
MTGMVKWAKQYAPPRSDISILEVGSGNGALLFALAGEACYPAERLLGIDYSEGAVQLAQSVGRSRGFPAVTFRVCNFLREDPPLLAGNHEADGDGNGAWDLILDKGTYDAIALMEKDENGIVPVEGYPMRITKLLNPGGRFLITCAYDRVISLLELNDRTFHPACNFTEAELQAKFITEATGLKYQYVT